MGVKKHRGFAVFFYREKKTTAYGEPWFSRFIWGDSHSPQYAFVQLFCFLNVNTSSAS